ncbi:MAG TPA: DegT/DnrJ/EryC1/StrS family aminotransferase [Thermoanaerobaculia bacterium]|jgi:perosamine synthetase|nr:DegT/DnrJ/EryC1/StrS family aminotransferase [Thermoanaerobaculia bacterium]
MREALLIRQGRWIPVASPSLAGNERAYVLDCMDSGAISSIGEYVARFEREFAAFCGVRHAIACCNGTAAVHLALLAHDVKAGDEVLVPTLTFVATANAVTYCGATPVFLDAESSSWCLDPAAIESKITPRTKGIIAVHLYGHPADMTAINDITRKHGLFVIEDAAEAHGALWNDRMAGSLGDIAAFSFYGNKTLTTGEGGMVVTDDDALAERVRLYRGQGMDPQRRYWFPVVGYNYRMTSLVAAVGVAQLERIDEMIERRLEIASWYREDLSRIDGISWQIEHLLARHAYWMFVALLPIAAEAVMAAMEIEGIETRPAFPPMHALPPYLDPVGSYPVAEDIARRGIALPTWVGLTREDVSRVCETLERCLVSEVAHSP